MNKNKKSKKISPIIKGDLIPSQVHPSSDHYKTVNTLMKGPFGLLLTKQARGNRDATFYKLFMNHQDAVYFCRNTSMLALANQVIRYSDALEGTRLLFNSEKGTLLIKSLDFNRNEVQYGQNSPRYYWNIVPLPIFTLKGKQ